MSRYHAARRLVEASPFEEHELIHGPAIFDGDDEALDDDIHDLPPCPPTLVIVDVQEEFNSSIGFDTQAFLVWLRECSAASTDFHIVYDEMGDRPEMFASLGPTYYAKCYGADPYEGVIDRETGEAVDPSDIEEDTIYHDPVARLDVFMSSGHEWQHVYPDMVELAGRLKGRSGVVLVGGAANECLRDMTHWLDISGVEYRLEWRFVYG